MKSGLVVLVGRSNVGKSTLLNTLVGTKVAITSPKPQTTRDIIRGILNDPRGQIVFVDTPGVFEHARDPLTRQINATARKALAGVDVVVYVVDPTRAIGTEEHRVHALLRNSDRPKILAINKADLHERARPHRDAYHDLVFGEQDPLFTAEFDVSALRRQNLNLLIDQIFTLLPDGEPMYPEGQVTDVPREFWLAELIREKVFLQMHQEIPYSTNVEVDEAASRADGTLYVRARILTTDDRYRKMLIGSGGRRIKEMGSMARKELETAMARKVYLDLKVETDPRWIR
ncbi:GTPase Era [Candidatus Uhrbacteria bacterium]|nr:GTPase Era [Candidatus Uhrbacteria bacterium]